ncbi:hypothetical protein R3P38DRAFT_1187814 [Favolaschia claudopus]|uniref:Uncharacterized protein n=1 Tax=Favolaschia claudopus TaxID=2862362 RepID=A0AAW0E2G4_9AGAR
MFQNVLVGFMIALRVYAMYSFSKRVLFFLVIATMTTITLAAWSTSAEKTLNINVPPSCEIPVSQESAVRMAAVWEAQFICDVIVFVLIVRRSSSYYLPPTKLSGFIMDHITRDGTLYFAVVALSNLVNILFYYFGDVRPFSSIQPLSWLAQEK